MEFEAGTLDLVSMDPTYVKGYQDGEYAKNLVKVDLQGIIALNLNVAIEPLDNLKVREALAYAIDKQAIVDSYLQGNGTAANSLIPPGIAGHSDELGEYNPEKAKRFWRKQVILMASSWVNYVSETSSIAASLWCCRSSSRPPALSWR